MGVVVQKYGGSSVRDIAALRVVAAQVAERHRAGDRIVVVVSAMGKTTDELLALASQLGPGTSRRELDMLVTAGERISVALLTIAIQQAGCDAISFTGSQSGIITEDAHGGARILEVRPTRLVEELERGRIVIVAGYQGVSTKKEITTLGRGGTDTTAVALAAALGADACEIYSDVDGVYTADPRVCPQAEHLPALNYEIMQAMAGAGAKVLNADAVAFARAAGITILARKTADPTGRETAVNREALHRREITAVVGASDVVWAQGSAEPPWDRLRALGARVLAYSRTAHGVAAAWRLTDVPDRPAVAELLRKSGLDPRAASGVSVVGPGAASEIAAISAHASAVLLAMPTVVTLEVAPDKTDTVVRALHRELIERA